VSLRAVKILFGGETFLKVFVWAAFLILIYFAPLALASNRPIPLYMVQMTVIAAFLAWFNRSVFWTHALTWTRSRVNLWALLFLFVGAFQALIPSGTFSAFGASVYSHATFDALMKYGVYFLIFWLTLSFVQTEKQISFLERAILILAFAASLLGIIQKLSGADKVLWFCEIEHGQNYLTTFFSTFINANHFAAFIGMVVLLILGRMFYLNAKNSSHHRSKRYEEKLFLIFALAVSSVALFMSLSRGGIILFTLSLFIFYWGILAEKKRKRSVSFLTLFIVSTVLMLAWIGLEPILKELGTLFQKDEVGLDSRFLVWQNVFSRLIQQYPLLGTGLGTFQYVFEGAKSVNPVFYGFWLHAHCDWIELFAETGVLGGTVFLLMVLSFFLETWPIRSNKWDPYIRYNGAAALGAMTYMILMSSYDFPLRTTACAVYFAVIAGFSVKLKQFQNEMNGKTDCLRKLSFDRPWKRIWGGGAVNVLVLVWIVFLTKPYLAKFEVRQDGKYFVQNLERAIWLDPQNADYHYWLGLAMEKEAFYDDERYNPDKMEAAIKEIEKAILLNPSQGMYHYGLARSYEKMKMFNQAKAEFGRALEKNPVNPFLRIYYAIFCFNRAMAESIIYEKEVTEMPLFQEGLEAYYRAKEISSSISLTAYRHSIAAFERLRKVFIRENYIPSANIF